MIYGEYQVIGRREYRGHATGTIFLAHLDRNAERRAIDRGDIQLIRRIEPGLDPGSWTLPDRWHPPPQPELHPDQTEAPRGASLMHEGG